MHDMLTQAIQILVTSAKSFLNLAIHIWISCPVSEKLDLAYMYLSRPFMEVSGKVLLTQSTLLS